MELWKPKSIRYVYFITRRSIRLTDSSIPVSALEGFVSAIRALKGNVTRLRHLKQMVWFSGTNRSTSSSISMKTWGEAYRVQLASFHIESSVGISSEIDSGNIKSSSRSWGSG
jgi:hypothetical protein